MAYFLGSDVKVTLTVEHETYGLHITSGTSKFYELAAASGAPTYGIGPMTAGALATSGTGLLNDVTGLDLGIGAMDEDVSYLGHRTPLKAEVHKETTVSLTIKRTNGSWGGGPPFVVSGYVLKLNLVKKYLLLGMQD